MAFLAQLYHMCLLVEPTVNTSYLPVCLHAMGVQTEIDQLQRSTTANDHTREVLEPWHKF